MIVKVAQRVQMQQYQQLNEITLHFTPLQNSILIVWTLDYNLNQQLLLLILRSILNFSIRLRLRVTDTVKIRYQLKADTMGMKNVNTSKISIRSKSEGQTQTVAEG